MKLLRDIADWTNEGPRAVCVAIGFFDGVHLGHQQVIRQAVADAEQNEAHSVVITFDCHPSAIVAPERTPPLVYSLPQRLRAIAGLGVDTTLLIHFDQAFSRQTGEQFILQLAAQFRQLRRICVGSSFKFGYQRSGNVALLQSMGTSLGFSVHGLAAVSLDVETVSSTRIRETVAAGRLDAAGQMLGRAYALAGRVIQGDHLGRTLGFPTANIEISGLALPPSGVYAVHAQTRPAKPWSLAPAQSSHRAVLNIGWRPTVNQARPVLRAEAHLFDFQGDLYDAELELTFVERLRDEQKFPSLEALKEQIARDIVAARSCFARLDR